MAGEIESIGRKVKKFSIGDRVFAYSGARMGCHAEYRCMPENGLLTFRPSILSDEVAAALSFGGLTVL